jgi:hypothetical protein
LNLTSTISKKLTARLEIRNRIFFGEQVAQTPFFGKLIDQYPGYLHLSKLWVDDKNFVVHSVIDRMLLQYASNKWDVTIGRQRINWGINSIWNPNDIFNAYNFLDFDYEERPGNDAVRIQHFLKDNSTVEVAYKPGRRKNEIIAAALYKFNRSQYDIQCLGGIASHDLVAGAGWAGSIKDAGFQGEISYFHPFRKITDSIDIVTASAKVDYTFQNNWYVMLSFLFNSSPSGMGFNLSNANITAKNLFPSRYSFYAGALKSFTPITSMDLAMVYASANHTLILLPSFAWNSAKDLDIDLTIQSFFWEQDRRFTSRGTTLFLRAKWNF